MGFNKSEYELASYFAAYISDVKRVQAGWTFILPSELSAKELRHLPRKMPKPGTT
jgi:hypothetical protein